MAKSAFDGWDEALEYAFEQASSKNTTLIFDEFPYLMRSSPGIDSVFQHHWDTHDGNLKLILNGSVMSVMEEQVMGPKAPLYGRRTEQLQLAPIGFWDLGAFYPNKAFEERFLFYGLFGGIPAYTERASTFEHPDEAALELILAPNGIFFQEPEFLVREELREPATYFSVLHALSSGNTRPNAISQAAGVPHGSIHRYLDPLIRMGFVSKETPAIETNAERSKKGIYRIIDPFLRFWFRYVFPNRSSIELGKGKQLFDQVIKPDLDHFLSPVFEDICRQFLLQNGRHLLGWDPFKLGRFWDSEDEIDMIAVNAERNKVAFIECKWSKSVAVEKTLRKLQIKSAKLKKYHDWDQQFLVMSRTQSDHPNHFRVGDAVSGI